MANVQTAAGAPEALWRQAPIGELVDLGRTFRGPLALSRLHTTPKGVLSRREGVLLGVDQAQPLMPKSCSWSFLAGCQR